MYQNRTIDYESIYIISRHLWKDTIAIELVVVSMWKVDVIDIVVELDKNFELMPVAKVILLIY